LQNQIKLYFFKSEILTNFETSGQIIIRKQKNQFKINFKNECVTILIDMKEINERLLLYFQNFSESIHPIDFAINLIIATILSFALSEFYIQFANVNANRRKFASNFVPLALTTMMVMIIVKSSLALSLGLVGALSIVRFRAAIKDPEELTYLFLVIGIGLCTGANQPFLAVLLMLFLFIFLYVHKLTRGKSFVKQEDLVYLNISTDINDLNVIILILENNSVSYDLKRMDAQSDRSGLDLSFTCKCKTIQEISNLKESLLKISDHTKISIIEKPDLIF
jgi:hypothetical protein